MFIFGKKKIMNTYDSIVRELEYAEGRMRYYQERLKETLTDDDRKNVNDMFEYWLGRSTSYLIVKNELDDIIHKVK